jgi:hypothetical protein
LNNSNQNNGQELLRLTRERGAPGQRQAQTAACPFLDLRKHNSVDDTLEKGYVGFLDRHGAVEHPLADYAALVDLREDALPDLFPDGGDTDHDGGTERLDIALTVAHRLVRERLDAAIAAAHANEEEAELDDVFENMREREESEKAIIRLEVVADEGHDGTNRGYKIGVLDDYALGWARGSGGVHDTRHIIAGRCAAFRGFGWFGTARLPKGIERDNYDTFASASNLRKNVFCGLTVVDHEPDGRGIPDDLGDDR